MKKLKKMIKSAILFAATGLAFGLTSCTNDNLESTSTNGSAEKLYVIYGGFAQNEDARMSLNTETNQYVWQVGDGVCLYKEDGSLLAYHTIGASEIQANGKVKLELRLSAEPKYITIAGKNGTYATDGAHVDVNTPIIDLYARTTLGVLSPDAPILGQAEMTTKTVGGVVVQAFAMQHKLAYVYIKEIKIDGEVLNNVYVTATSGTMKITDVKNQSAEASLSNVSQIKSSIMTGYVIAVIPGTTLTISKDAGSPYLVNAKLSAGYYTVSRDITSDYTMTYVSDNTAHGTVSSATEMAMKGGAASAVTATANTDYKFEGWYNNGVKLGASGTDANGNGYTVSGAVLTITNAQSSASYVAKFASLATNEPTNVNTDNSTLCAGASANISATVISGASAKYYTVATGGVGTAMTVSGTSATATVSPSSTTTYYVSQTVDGVESSRVSVQIIVNPKASISSVSIDGTKNITTSQSTTLTANVSGASNAGVYTYLWNNGATTQSINVSGLSAGSHIYTCTVTPSNTSGCVGDAKSGTATVVVVASVTNEPTNVKTDNSMLCAGASANISATVISGASAKYYTVATGGAGTAMTVSGTSATATVAPSSTTTYYVSQTVNGVESSRVGVQIIVNPKASISSVSIDGTKNITTSQSTTLTANVSGASNAGLYTYLWNNGATTQSINVSGLSAGSHIYTCTVTPSNTSGCVGDAKSGSATVVVSASNYVFTVDGNSSNYAGAFNVGGSTSTFTVVSLKDGANLGWTSTIVSGSEWIIKNSETTYTATANTSTSPRYGSIKFTQNETGKIIIVNETQLGAQEPLTPDAATCKNGVVTYTFNKYLTKGSTHTVTFRGVNTASTAGTVSVSFTANESNTTCTASNSTYMKVSSATCSYANGYYTLVVTIAPTESAWSAGYLHPDQASVAPKNPAAPCANWASVCKNPSYSEYMRLRCPNICNVNNTYSRTICSGGQDVIGTCSLEPSNCTNPPYVAIMAEKCFSTCYANAKNGSGTQSGLVVTFN